MKVLLINPSSELLDTSPKLRTFLTPIPPLGIASIAAVLEREGIEVKALDQFANKMSNQKVLLEIKKYAPDVVGFSCLTPVINNVKNLVKEIRKLNNCLVVLGNIHPTIFTEELLRDGSADIIVKGEGELTVLDLIKAIRDKKDLHNVSGISFREGDDIFHNQNRALVQDLDQFPYPAWHLFEFKNYKETPQMLINNQLALPILGSRGCPYRCIFCAQDTIYPKPRYRKIENIVKEIEFMHEHFKAKFFGFFDAYFPFSLESGMEFCNGLMRCGLHKKIKWCTETRVDLVTEELLMMMKKSGVHLIMFGLESGNQDTLNRINKRITLEQARRAIKIAKKVKIYTLGLFMLGLPGETKDSCRDTIRFAKELDCDVVKFNLAVPYPGSKMFTDFYKGRNFVFNPEKFTSWYDWAETREAPVYVPEDMHARELIYLQRKAMLDFYVRPKIIARFLINRRVSLSNIIYGGYILLSKYLSNVLNNLFSKLRLMQVSTYK
jgi:anaerobic magnesium-protoporphyrin IX monomethyl ester cyclase